MAQRRPPLARFIGRRIASLRAELGLTQERLAWDTGLESKGYLSRIESGQRLPSLDLLERVSRQLNVQPRDLLVFPEHDKIAAAMELLRLGGDAAADRLIITMAAAPAARKSGAQLATRAAEGRAPKWRRKPRRRSS